MRLATTLTRALLLTAAGGALAACAPEPLEPTGEAAAPIINGAVDTGDPAVVLVFAQNQTAAYPCSGFVVSPHVIVTAAHCIDPAILTPKLGATYQLLVFTGDDIHDPAQSSDPENRFTVASSTISPLFAGLPPAGYVGEGPDHDIGALITDEPLPAAPLPLNRTALDQASVGAPLRIVGFGNSKASDTSSYGTRRQGAQTIVALDATHITVDGAPNLCGGDSGGASLFTRNGVESVAGVHSWVEHATSCTGKAFDVRVDIDVAAFIDPLIAMHDPGFVPPEDGSGGSGGGGTGTGGSGNTGTGTATTSTGTPSGTMGGGGEGGEEPAPGAGEESSGCAVSRAGVMGSMEGEERGWVGLSVVAIACALGVRRPPRGRRRSS